jgi:hypothetical protein
MPSANSRLKYKPNAELVLVNNLSLGSRGVEISPGTDTRRVTLLTNNFSEALESAEVTSVDTAGVTAMRKLDGSLPDLKFMRLNVSVAGERRYIDKGTPVKEVEYHGSKGIPFHGKAPDLGAFEAR